MEKLQASEIKTAVAGMIVSGQEDTCFTDILLDSRKAKEGDLFVPLAGERVDGHDFIISALQNGASGSLSKKDWPGIKDFPKDKTLILVDDVLKALQTMSGAYIDKLAPANRIGITGSNGKTSTKDLIASVLEQKFSVCKTKGNHNNEIGVPITLCSLTKEDDILVTEMGMRGIGQIKELTDFVKPNIGVVTNVGQSHLELLGTQENIALAKGELMDCLPERGYAILNADDVLVCSMAKRTKANVLFYGCEKGDIRGENIASLGQAGTSFDLCLPGGQRIKINLPLLGLHNVYNALAAAAVGHALSLTIEEIKAGLEHPVLTAMRLEVVELQQNMKLINDAYNASPASMSSALKILADIKKENKGSSLAVLGNMYELGDDSSSMHYAMGKLAAETGVDHLLAVGDLALDIAKGARENGLAEDKIICVKDQEEAKEHLDKYYQDKLVILLKASRSMHLDKLASCFPQ